MGEFVFGAGVSSSVAGALVGVGASSKTRHLHSPATNFWNGKEFMNRRMITNTYIIVSFLLA